MKTIRCILIILLFSAFSFYVAPAQSFKGGLLAGLSTSQVDGDTHSGYNRAGLIFGGYVGLGISEKISAQMEMKFIQKGSYKNQNPDAGDFKIYSLRLNYVEMPFLIKYQYKYKLTFEAGLGFGYLASYKEGDESGTFTDYVQIHPFHKFELSYQIGGYYQLFNNLSVNVRYSYSLLPIRQHINGENKFLFSKGQFNNVICFSLYYQFNKPSE
ncbi:MAG: porin family protein [Bacteroidales bacterium]